ncbi:hypothetical protein Tco_0596354 [Tanacetum coccineum]
MMFLAYASPTHLNHGDKYDFWYNVPSISLYNEALIRSFLAFYGSSRSFPNCKNSQIHVIQLSSSSWVTSATSFYVTDFSCSTSTRTSLANLENVIEASLLSPASNASINPAPEPLELEAPSVNNFHAFYGSGSFLLASPSFISLSFLGRVLARKSASVCPLIEFLPLDSISCSPVLLPIWLYIMTFPALRESVLWVCHLEHGWDVLRTSFLYPKGALLRVEFQVNRLESFESLLNVSKHFFIGVTLYDQLVSIDLNVSSYLAAEHLVN